MRTLRDIIELAVDTSLLDGLPTLFTSGATAKAAHAFKVAFMVYALRGAARAHDHQYLGGLFGGALKYALKDTGTMPWFYEPCKGALNNLLYEINRDYMPKGYENFVPVAIESLESVVHGFIQGYLTNGFIGGLNGAVNEGSEGAFIAAMIASSYALFSTESSDFIECVVAEKACPIANQHHYNINDVTPVHYNQTPLAISVDFVELPISDAVQSFLF